MAPCGKAQSASGGHASAYAEAGGLFLFTTPPARLCRATSPYTREAEITQAPCGKVQSTSEGMFASLYHSKAPLWGGVQHLRGHPALAGGGLCVFFILSL